MFVLLKFRIIFEKAPDIQPAKEIKPILKPEYVPVEDSDVNRNISSFKDKSYRIGQSLFEQPKNHLENHTSKFNLRYNKPKSIVTEEAFSLGNSK